MSDAGSISDSAPGSSAALPVARSGVLPPPVTPPPITPRPPSPRPPGGAPPKQPGSFMSRMRNNPDGEGAKMGFIDHLMELRRRLWVSVLAIAICVTLAMIFYDLLFDQLRQPLDNLNAQYAAREDYAEVLLSLGLPPGSQIAPIISTNMLGTMMMVMWLGIGAGLVLSSPIVVYELWGFISPGLRDVEKRAIKPVLYGGILFFIAGCFLAYYVLFPATLDFTIWLNVKLKIKPMYTVDDYMSLILNMMLITGLICEIPLVVAVLAKLSIVKPSYLTRYWRWCVMIAFVFGAVFSPGTDVMSMMIFSALLMSVYLASIAMAFIFFPRNAK
jgi:sec-independent protein translocase protein TatC